MATVAAGTKVTRGKATKDGNGKATAVAATVRERVAATILAPAAGPGLRKRAKAASETAATVSPPAPVPVGRARQVAEGRGGKRAAETFKMAGDATRLRVLAHLAGGGGSNVGDMARDFGLGQPALSHHLALLRHAGLVEPTRQGKENRYELTPRGETLARLAAELGAAE